MYTSHQHSEEEHVGCLGKHRRWLAGFHLQSGWCKITDMFPKIHFLLSRLWSSGESGDDI